MPLSYEIKVDSFSYSWKGVRQNLFQNVGFSVNEGECLAIMGPSGSGKSTLLKILLGLETEAKGVVKFGSEVISLQEPSPLSKLFSLVPQSPLLLPWKTVSQNLLMVCQSPSDQSSSMLIKSANERIEELLAVVGLSNSAQKYPWQLSQGMAARASFARTLLLDTPILLLDEPFAALDAYKKEELGSWLVTLRRNTKKTMILVTHDKHEAAAVANSTFHLS
jgi:ABC-type nitrate/sulfonate/bicarbonate transport system ATPase subunit